MSSLSEILAIYLNIALLFFFNIVDLKKSTFTDKVKLVVLVGGILSTLSTTGYVTLVLSFIYYTTKSKKKLKVFVYGTLKQGNRNHGYLAGAKFLYKAQTLKKFAMVGKEAPFPYLLGESKHGYNVIGEVYEIEEDTKEALDILEGCPYHYMEQEIVVNPIYKSKDIETVGFSNIKVTTYTKTNTTKRPSLLALYPKEDYIKEW